MSLQNILPSYQAEEKSAQMQLRPVRMPSHLEGIGNMLTDAGQGLQRAGVGLALSFKRRHDELQAREDNLMMTEKTNAFTAEAAKAFQELSYQKGANASGTTTKLSAAFDRMLNTYSADMNQKNARIFKMNATRIANSYLIRMMDHEHSNVTQAELAATNQELSDCIQLFASTNGNMDQYYRAFELLDKALILRDGGIPDEKYLDMEEIGDEEIEKRVGAYKREASNLQNSLASVLFDKRIQDEDIKGAQELYDTFNTEYGIPASEAAMASMDQVLTQKREGLEVHTLARAWFSDTKAKAGKGSPDARYPTAEEQQAYAENRQKIINSKHKNKAEILREYDQLWNAHHDVQKANVTADVGAKFKNAHLYKDHESRGAYLSHIRDEINALPPSAMKDDALETLQDWQNVWDREELIRNEKNEAERLRMLQEQQKKADAIKNNPTRKAYAGFAKMIAGQEKKVFIDGRHAYDLSNETDRELFFHKYSAEVPGGFLTKEDIDYISRFGSQNGGVMDTERIAAAIVIRDNLNSGNREKPWTVDMVVAALPDLLDETERYMYSMTNGYSTKVKETDLKGVTSDFVSQRLLEERKTPSAKETLRAFVGRGLNKDGVLDPNFSQVVFKKSGMTDKQRETNNAREKQMRLGPGGINAREATRMTLDAIREDQKRFTGGNE